ncbi:MAG: GNAT family protein [Micrococcaceae bacterium]
MYFNYWPVTLRHGPIVLRPISRHDRKQYYAVKFANKQWLQEWEATTPEGTTELPFSVLRKVLNREAKQGRMLPFVIEHEGQLIGQLTVGNIQYGSASSANIGYWISQEFAGRGYVPLAVAMAVDYCFHELLLHRIEVHIRPENLNSLRVVQKLGFREEGYRRAYLHINGKWADHISFALCKEDVQGYLVDTL